ncbi:MAG: hypothetical protein CMB80_26595 [Flammeovirgaceae bacterium]|nr:hypothetical protein [Flammeovirgaceae bacterium]
MTIIVENGSIVAGANSYVTRQEVQDYADLRGIDYPCGTELDQNIILANDYLQSRCYQGEQVDPSTQPLLWPRKYVYIYNQEVASDSIPQQLKNAQIELALAQTNTDVMNNGVDRGDNVKRKKTDVLEVEYYEGGNNYLFSSQRVNSYLQLLVKQLGVVRV